MVEVTCESTWVYIVSISFFLLFYGAIELVALCSLLNKGVIGMVWRIAWSGANGFSLYCKIINQCQWPYHKTATVAFSTHQECDVLPTPDADVG